MSELHNDCYAYSAMRKYPIHTKQAALASFNEYLSDLDSIPEQRCDLINQNFRKAASFHGIKYPQPLPDKVQRETVEFDCNDSTLKISKIASVTDINSIYDNLIENRKNIPFKTMQKIALYAYKQGQSLNADQQTMDKLQKLAGLGIGDKEHILDQFLKRSSLIMLPEDTKKKFFDTYKQMNQQDQEKFFKQAADAACLLDNIDKLYNLQNQYGKYIETPQNACFSTGVSDLIKQASDYLHVTSSDVILSKQALLQKKASVDKFLKQKYNFTYTDTNQMFSKIASLNKIALTALINELDK